MLMWQDVMFPVLSKRQVLCGHRPQWLKSVVVGCSLGVQSCFGLSFSDGVKVSKFDPMPQTLIAT